ncbi:hypothetical protein [Caproicibacter fermentans]|uniref:Uncharacterized protein n=1 Tax=Caproicibacter fermentans TaxID=2576756 RepID=A0A7G8TD70_9FIRM|nr:hypothetical protein [Caproicibacter fermentans]QNK41561.1 hypothetical protein HCR03_04670 [Caproicibacter fermentans]
MKIAPSKELISGIRAGLQALRENLVEPMGLSITAHDGKFGWGFYKYKALPGHPHPGNAGNGWSHPVNTPVLAAHAPRDWPKDGSFPRDVKCTLNDVKAFVQAVADGAALGRDYTLEVAWRKGSAPDMCVDGAVGILSDINILRGGAENYAYYPDSIDEVSLVSKNGEPVDTAKEELWKGKFRRLKDNEQISTNAYMQPPKVDNPIVVAGAWYVDSLPGGIVAELTDGKLVSFSISPLRAIDAATLKSYDGEHPRKQHGSPLPKPLYPFYGLEKNDESLSEILRLRVTPSEKAAFEAYAASLEPRQNVSDVLREFIRSKI